MKIIYAAGPRVGADLLMSRFITHSEHEIKTAAYVKSSNSLFHVDWTLDAVYNKYTGCDRAKLVDLFGRKSIPMMGYNQVISLIQDVEAFGPNLIICDCEPIFANIAKSLDIPLWYCSPVHLLDGLQWKPGQIRYAGLLENDRKLLSKLPEADKVFVHSPFFSLGLDLKPGYEWLMPETHEPYVDKHGTGICVTNDSERVSELSKILNCIPPFDLVLFSPHKYNLSHLESYLLDEPNYSRALGSANWLFCTGETSIITDALCNEVSRICISPDLNDPESLLNASIIRLCGLGDDVAQVEYLESYSVDTIQDSYSSRFRCEYKCDWDENIPTLNRLLEEL